nr:hypothetical protein [Candidatus Microthrix sp.]
MNTNEAVAVEGAGPATPPPLGGFGGREPRPRRATGFAGGGGLDPTGRVEALGERRVGEHELWVDQLDQAGPLGRGQRRVDPGDDRSEGRRSGGGDQVLQARWQHQGHPVALPDASARHPPGQCAGLAPPRRVAQRLAVPADDCGRVAEAQRRSGERVGQACGRSVAHRHGARIDQRMLGRTRWPEAKNR